MAAPYGNSRSKLDRAIVAYLIYRGIGVNPPVMTAANVFPCKGEAANVYPRVVVTTMKGTPEPGMTGRYRCTVWISVKSTATEVVTNTNPSNAIVKFGQLLASVSDAMMGSDNSNPNPAGSLRGTAEEISIQGRLLATTGSATDQANNADMVDFTCGALYDDGFGISTNDDSDEGGTAWEEVLSYIAAMSNANTD